MAQQKLNLPRDNFGNGVQVARLGAAKTGVAGAVSTAVQISDGVVIIEIWASEDMRYQTGGADVVATANSHFLAAGERLQRALWSDGVDQPPHTHIAILRAGTANATVEISELQ